MADLVAYEHKHNDANGEQNRDGTNENLSWNNGVEGETEDSAVRAARLRDQRNLLATLLFSRGTPMLGPGAEIGQTQHGNNNGYAQDNAISWTNWARADGELPGFVALLIALRGANPALNRDRFLTGTDIDEVGYPDVTWRRADGHRPEDGEWTDRGSQTLVAELTAPAELEGADLNRVVVALHAGRLDTTLYLPETRRNHVWRLALDTGFAAAPVERLFGGGVTCPLPARSVLLFVEEQGIASGGPQRPVAADTLDRLAAAAGIAPEWFELTGVRHAVQPDTKRALLNAMGLSVGSTGEARDSLDELASLRDRRLLPKAIAARTGQQVQLRLATRALGRPIRLTVLREDGSQEAVTISVSAQARVETGCDGRPVTVLDAVLPRQPVGRHHILVDTAPDIDCALTVAPDRSYLPERLVAGGRAFGIAAHLYTLRGTNDCGIGDFGVLGEFAEAAGRHGAELVGINPVHALFNERRDRASPYHPSDRRFLDPIYIDLGRPEVLGDDAAVQAVLERNAGAFATLRDLRFVDYPGVWAVKQEVLEVAFQAFETADRSSAADFKAFVAEGGEALRRFAIFEAIAETMPDRDWLAWPDALRRPDSPELHSFAKAKASRVRFQLYLQWLADRQLAAAAERGRKSGLDIGLYRDIAVGTAPDGAEAWAEQGAYARGVSVGSPPDPFSASGQIWCLPPPNPVARDRSGSTLLGGLLRANMRHAGALRIDHAMGLSRLFWVPDGAPGSAGAYVGYDFEANLADVALESHRARCLVIGEDLGTVQEGFRDTLDRNDILSYRVLFFERDGVGFKPASAYPHNAVACVATHDISPLAGWWRGDDIEERKEVGQLDAAAAERAVAERSLEREKLAQALGQSAIQAERQISIEPLTREVHRFVADTPSMLVVAQVDDLVGETIGVNLPGTDRERPNWRRRLPLATGPLFARVESDGTLPPLPLRSLPRSTDDDPS